VSGGWSASALATHQRSLLIAHQIKITDFGLAKRLDEPGLTQSGAVMGTPSYMAPEQAAGNSAAIGPPTDVYALGAILYEMLTGRPPFRGTTPLETVLQVQFQEPVPPRRLLPACPRDLETICLKCLHKESYRRYGSALELAADLHSFLAGEPIRARPVGPVERGWRWCSRNKAVAGALAAVAVVALVGLTAVFAEWTRAETNFRNMLFQKQEAEKNYEAMSAQKQLADKNLEGMRVEFQRAEQNLQAARNAVREHFIDLSEIVLSKEPETEKYQKRRLEQALHYFKGFIDQRPQDVGMRTEVAEANFRVADITAKIGSSDDALAYYLQAQQLYEQLSREGHANPTTLFDLGNIYNNIGVALMDKGQWDHAEEYFHKGLEVRRKLAQDSPPKSTMPTDPVYARHVRNQNSLGATYLNLGKLYYKTAQRAHAEKTLEEARLILQPSADAGYTESVRSLASCLNDLGVVYAETGKREAAAKAHGESLKHYLQIVADNAGNSDLRAELASTYNNSGIRLRALTQWGEARLAHQKAVQILLSLVDAYPHVTYYRNQLARVLVDLGRAQRELGQYSDACASFEKAQEHFKKSLKVDPQNADLLRSLALSYNYAGDTHSQSQQWQEASRDHEQALAIQEELVKAHPAGSDFRADLARSYSYLGELLDARGDLQEALRSQTKARDIQRELVDSRGDVIEYRFELSRTYQRIGYVHVRTGNKEALPAFELARKLQEELVKAQPNEPQFRDRLAATWCHIGELHQATGQRKAAQEAMEEAYKIRTKLREEHPDILGNNWQLAKIEHGIGVAFAKRPSWAEALPHFDVARSLYADLIKILPENPDLRHHMVITIIAYGITLEKLGKTKEALAARMQAIEHGRVLVEKLPRVEVYRRILTGELNDASVLQRQLGQLATAAALALERCKLWPKDAKELHEAARELVKCLVTVQTKGQPSEEDQVLARQLGEQAVDTLRRAVELGTMPVEKLLNDPVLEPLRTREDFQKLIKARKME
jgi:tetratricopeptide (TPR) repeat protein